KNRVASGSGSYYWASEQNSSNNGYLVRFDTGATNNNNKTNSYRARCVRGLGYIGFHGGSERIGNE
ncbi:MAG: hypothetical protein LUF85_13745, partial [Bacteroides sp.]|nr:hypothetical protein [Bacteroides sp.]